MTIDVLPNNVLSKVTNIVQLMFYCFEIFLVFKMPSVEHNFCHCKLELDILCFMQSLIPKQFVEYFVTGVRVHKNIRLC